LAVNPHAASLDGASPKYSVAAAFASGEMMWFIQRYMQFGFFAFDEIIQVSDQPVEPSFGRTDATGTFSPSSTFVITCHVVPTTLSPPVNAAICFV
jgi:hypothetical protein